jgi:hypothetical protein
VTGNKLRSYRTHLLEEAYRRKEELEKLVRFPKLIGIWEEEDGMYFICHATRAHNSVSSRAKRIL